MTKLKAYTPEWFSVKEQELQVLCDELSERGWHPAYFVSDDPTQEVMANTLVLWRTVVGKVSRAPKPLMVDCLYICAKLSGNRVGIKAVKRATKFLYGKSVEVLPLDRRRDLRRWVWTYKAEILALYPDKRAWDDFVSAWRDNTVEPAYFDEEPPMCLSCGRDDLELTTVVNHQRQHKGVAHWVKPGTPLRWIPQNRLLEATVCPNCLSFYNKSIKNKELITTKEE